METKQIEVATLVRAGKSTSDIVKLLKVHRETVYRVRKRLENGDTLKYRHGPKKTPKLTPAKAKKAFKANPTMSIAEFARKKEDQGVAIDHQDRQRVWQVVLRVPAGWSTRAYSAHSAIVDVRKHGVLAEDFLASTEPGFESLGLQHLVAS